LWYVKLPVGFKRLKLYHILFFFLTIWK